VTSTYSAPWEIIILPPGRNYHTPHRGSRSPLEEIILFTPHRGMGSLPTGGDYHTPNKGGAFHHRGSPPPPGETIDSPTGIISPQGRPVNLPKGSQNKDNKQVRTHKQSVAKPAQRVGPPPGTKGGMTSQSVSLNGSHYQFNIGLPPVSISLSPADTGQVTPHNHPSLVHSWTVTSPTVTFPDHRGSTATHRGASHP